MCDTLTKENHSRAKNRIEYLADTPATNLIKAKLTENVSLNRQYSFIDFQHFLASDAKVGGWVALNL